MSSAGPGGVIGTTKAQIYVAINDLLVYGSAITRPTGIQRVASGLATELMQRYGAVSVSISSSGMRAATVPDATQRSLAARLAEPVLRLLSYAPRRAQESFRSVARSLLSRSARSSGGAALTPAPGSWLVLLGAPWIAPGMADAACELRQRGGVRLALLVHDLLPATSPRWFADAQGEAAKRDVETLIAAADQIFAVSAEVVAELSARYGKSSTLLMPADPELGSTAEVRGAATTGAAPLADERTILSVGTLHPRKNLVALIRLWDAWAREAESAGAARESVPRLVLVGRRHPQDGELFAVLAAHPRAAKRVTLIHTADDEQLAELYRSSRFLVMPSLAEGWGLPVREALLAGRPSIATDAVPAATGSPFARVVPAGDEAALGVAIREWWEGDTPERLSVEIQRTFVARTWEDVAAELAAQLSN